MSIPVKADCLSASVDAFVVESVYVKFSCVLFFYWESTSKFVSPLFNQACQIRTRSLNTLKLPKEDQWCSVWFYTTNVLNENAQLWLMALHLHWSQQSVKTIRLFNSTQPYFWVIKLPFSFIFLQVPGTGLSQPTLQVWPAWCHKKRTSWLKRQLTLYSTLMNVCWQL